VKLDLLARIVVIAALAAGISPLRNAIKRIKTDAANERRSSSRAVNPAATSAMGIDVWGRLRFQTLPSDARRFVLFAVRQSSLSADLLLWEQVASRLPRERGVYLVGYCDNSACVNSISGADHKPTFSVLAFGEPAALQAVLSADGKGESLLATGGMRPLRRFKWRTPEPTADNILNEVLK